MPVGVVLIRPEAQLPQPELLSLAMMTYATDLPLELQLGCGAGRGKAQPILTLDRRRES